MHGDDEAGGKVGDADGGIGGVDALTAMTAGAVDVDAEVFLFDFEVLFGSFGKDGDGGSAGVDATLRLGNWDALDAVNTAFEFELTVSVVATDFEDDFFHTAGFVLVFA